MLELSKDGVAYKLYKILEMLDKGELTVGTKLIPNENKFTKLEVVEDTDKGVLVLRRVFPSTLSIVLNAHICNLLWTIEPPEETFLLVSRTLQSSEKDGVDDYLDMALTKLEDKEHYTLTSFCITDTPTRAQTFTQKEIDDIPDSFGLSYNYDRIPLPISFKYTLD